MGSPVVPFSPIAFFNFFYLTLWGRICWRVADFVIDVRRKILKSVISNFWGMLLFSEGSPNWKSGRTAKEYCMAVSFGKIEKIKKVLKKSSANYRVFSFTARSKYFHWYKISLLALKMSPRYLVFCSEIFKFKIFFFYESLIVSMTKNAFV